MHVRTFSEEFRKQVVSEIEIGGSSVNSVNLQYGILGHSTVLKWLRRYGTKEYPMNGKRSKSKSWIDQPDEVSLLRNQIKLLESELKESRNRQAALEALFEVVEETYSTNVKKNFGGKQQQK